VGLVDVDVYGPDVPIMMGAKGKPGMFDNKIIPVEAHGIKIMSIGLLVADREALVWRGPMIHSPSSSSCATSCGAPRLPRLDMHGHGRCAALALPGRFRWARGHW